MLTHTCYVQNYASIIILPIYPKWYISHPAHAHKVDAQRHAPVIDNRGFDHVMCFNRKW